MLKQNFISVLVGLFSLNLNAQTLITGVTATASSEHHPTVYSATHAVNGNGLYLGSYPNQIHHGGGHSGVGNYLQACVTAASLRAEEPVTLLITDQF